MQYKGEDLDLRVPHARAPRESYVADFDPVGTNGRWARPRMPAPAQVEPLWVDEVLLACCNYAFDVAQANGAAEVGLEHLVNALTRVDTAARTLEVRGVHEGQLRRESAALIASEIPAANAGEAAAPRRSPELEDALRRASELAHRRGTAAGVDDVLWVLLHFGRDSAVVQLLRRLTPDWQRADWGRAREVAPPEPQPRAVQVVASETFTTRVASIEDSLRLLQSELLSERKLLMDLVRDIQRDIVAQRGDAAAFRGDLGHRLEALERGVQTRVEPRLPIQLTDRLAAIEKGVQASLGETSRATAQLGQRLAAVELALGDGRMTVAQQAIADRMASLEQSLHAGLGDGRIAAAQQSLLERMATLEKSVHGGLGEGARNWAHLGQRLAAIETAIGERRDAGPAAAALVERLTGIERSLDKGLGDRLGAIERLVGEGRRIELPAAVTERLTVIERGIEASGGEATRRWNALSERMGGLGRLVEAMSTESNRSRLELAERLETIETRISQPTAAAAEPDRHLIERLAGLERAVRAGFGDAVASTGGIGERLALVEKSLAAQPRDDSEALLILDDRLGTIERMLEARGNETTSATHEIVERLRVLEQRPASQPLDVSTVIAPLSQRLDGLEGTSIAKVDAVQTSLTQVLDRIGGLETRMQADAAVNEEALKGRDQDFDFIYSEIKQLGQSQATLNSAVNDWRSESQSHFGTLAGRLDRLQVAVTPPEPPTVPPAIDMPAVVTKARDGGEGPVASEVVIKPATTGRAGQPSDAVKADDYALAPQQGRGFWFWLFGTDDVLRANRENELKVDRMRQNIRDAKERRKGQA